MYSVVEIKTYEVRRDSYTTVSEHKTREEANLVALSLYQSDEKLKERHEREKREATEKVLIPA